MQKLILDIDELLGCATPRGWLQAAADHQDVLLIDHKPRTFRNDELIPALQKAIFEAKDGTVPAAVDTPEAEIVMVVLQRQHVEEKEAAPQIEKELRQRKLDAQIDDLKKKAGVWMDDDYFKNDR